MPNGECEVDCADAGMIESVDFDSGTKFCTCPYGFRWEDYGAATAATATTEADDGYARVLDESVRPSHLDKDR